MNPRAFFFNADGGIDGVKSTRRNPEKWVRFEKGDGWKSVSADVRAWVAPDVAWTTVPDPNIPTWAELTNDGEIFADNIPELVEQGHQIERDLAKWEKQGWWPKPTKVKVWRLAIIHRPSGSAFAADFETAAEAKAKGDEAIPRVRMRRRPRWLIPIE